MNYVDDLLFKNECFQIIGLSMKVHNTLGKGFKEIIYKDALELEFVNNTIPYEREKKFSVFYKDVELKSKVIADFIVFGDIILEIKAKAGMPAASFKQTLNYLKATEIDLGILINFGGDRLNFQRIINTNY